MVEFLRFAAPDLIFFHPSNEVGSRRTGEMGKLVSMGLQAGVADLIFCLPGGLFGAIELKSPKGRVTMNQLRWAQLVTAHGGRAAVCRSLPDVEKTLRAWGVPLRATVLPSGVFKSNDQ